MIKTYTTSWRESYKKGGWERLMRLIDNPCHFQSIDATVWISDASWLVGPHSSNLHPNLFCAEHKFSCVAECSPRMRTTIAVTSLCGELFFRRSVTKLKVTQLGNLLSLAPVRPALEACRQHLRSDKRGNLRLIAHAWNSFANQSSFPSSSLPPLTHSHRMPFKKTTQTESNKSRNDLLLPC